MVNKGPITSLLAFTVLARDVAILASDSGVFCSRECVDDPQYIVIPVVFYRDIFMYYSFAGEPFRLYRLKKAKTLSPNARKFYKVRPSNGCRNYNIKEMLLDYSKALCE